jgi:hypothetical protein
MGVFVKKGWAWLGVALLALPACGSSGDGGGGSSPGGAAGAAGSDAGTAGSGGQAGGAAGMGGTSGASGTGGVAGTGGVGGTAGMGGTGGAAGAGNACNDPGPEPNNSEPLASPACGASTCDATDCDGTGSSSYGGPLASATGMVGPGDIDYMHYHGKDTLSLCTVDPTVSTQDSGYRLCAFVACDLSATHFLGCNQGTHAKSPNGLDGCCVDAPGAVEINHDCTSSVSDDDSATIYIRVDEAAACTPYTVDYHF